MSLPGNHSCYTFDPTWLSPAMLWSLAERSAFTLLAFSKTASLLLCDSRAECLLSLLLILPRSVDVPREGTGVVL